MIERGDPGSAVTLTHGVRIEPCRYDDPGAAELVNELYSEQVDTYGYADLPDRDVARDYDQPGGLFLLALGSGGQAVGCGGVRTYDRQQRVAEIRKMYVRPDWRGRGVGRLVLEQLEAHAAGNGAGPVDPRDRRPERRGHPALHGDGVRADPVVRQRPPRVEPGVRQAAMTEDDDRTEVEADDEPYLGVGRFDAPPLPPMAAVVATGVLCGLATVGLVWLSQRGCDAARNTSSCGSMGLPLLLLIVAGTIVLGVVVLRRLLVPRAGLTAFLGVCFSLLVMLAVLSRWLLSPWMLLVVPVTSAVTFVAARLVVSRL